MVVSSFQFTNPSITDVQFSKNSTFNPSANVTMKNNFNISINQKVDNSAKVELALIINEDKKDDSPFYLSLKISALFKWTEDIKNTDVFLQQNAPALLLSYARPFISNLVISAGLPPYYIPFIDFTKKS